MDSSERRRELAKKYAHRDRSLAALEALRRSLGIPEDTEAGHGVEWLLSSSAKPVVEVRCSEGDRIGGVWRTSEAGVFVAWPSVSQAHEIRTHTYTVMGAAGSRRRAVVDLIADDDPFATDAALRVSCSCHGLWALAPGTRGRLDAEYRTALTGRPAKIFLHDRVSLSTD